MKKIKLLIFCFFLPSIFLSQVANDDCFGAVDLGTLSNPSDCFFGNGQGNPSTFNLSNVGAVAENPYTTLVNCQGSGVDMSSPAADVWYSFTATGNNLDVNIAGLNHPKCCFVLWCMWCLNWFWV